MSLLTLFLPRPAAASGAIAKINGVPIANIAKVDGVPVANIEKVNGKPTS